MYFSKEPFYEDSENDNSFFLKILKIYSTLKLFFPIQHRRELNFNFPYILHVNRVFQACIHDTRLKG